MDNLKKIANVIEQNDNFVIISHINPDGDSVGSQLALYGILKKLLNKKVYIIDADPIPHIYEFLPFSSAKKTKYSKKILFDIVIVLDCGDLKRAGKLPINIESAKTIINIDHHISNINFGHLNYVDYTASSTGELIFRLLKKLKLSPDKDIAMCLYSAIMTDTGGYKYENTTSGAFSSAAELVNCGIYPEKIAKKIYENNALCSMHLLGIALQTLTLKANGKISYMFVTQKMMQSTSAKGEHTEGFVNYTRTVEGVEIGIFFREAEDGFIKVSMRSKEFADTNKITGFFGGGGHKRASGCVIKGDLNSIIKKVIKKAEEEL